MKIIKKNKFIFVDFWISELFILILGNYYRWMVQCNITSTCITILIIAIIIQYCIFHANKLFDNKMKWYWVILIELSFVVANIFVIVGNKLWLVRSSEINFGFIFILVILLCPMSVVNSKLFKKTEDNSVS